MFGRVRTRIATSLLLSVASLVLSASAAHANVVREEATVGLDTPVCSWSDPSHPTRAIAIAVHGVTMHGGVFNTTARKLASKGIVVYAPDMRGYGRQMTSTIDYESSYRDLQRIVHFARAQHPNVPLFCMGESLGADFTLRAAVDMPGAFDGIILASPAIKLHSFALQRIEMTVPVVMNPRKQINLTPFFRKFASEDPQIVEAALSDPLVRKHMSAIELQHSINTTKSALTYASKIPKDMSVLVIQGTDDHVVKANAVRKLIAKLHSDDQTVRWFEKRGHLLLETEFVRPDTLELVENWITERLEKSERARAVALTKALGLQAVASSNTPSSDWSQLVDD